MRGRRRTQHLRPGVTVDIICTGNGTHGRKILAVIVDPRRHRPGDRPYLMPNTRRAAPVQDRPDHDPGQTLLAACPVSRCTIDKRRRLEHIIREVDLSNPLDELYKAQDGPPWTLDIRSLL